MLDDFHMVIEDFAAKEMSTRICSLYDKWINQDGLVENKKQVITEIKNLSKPYPIVEYEVVFFYTIILCFCLLCLINIFYQ